MNFIMFKRLLQSSFREYIFKNQHIISFNSVRHWRKFLIPSRQIIRLLNSSVLIEKNISSECYVPDKIIYNSFIHKSGFVEKKKLEKLEKKRGKKTVNVTKNLPVSLKYIIDDEEKAGEIDPAEDIEISDSYVNLPFSAKTIQGNIFIDSFKETNYHTDLVNETSGIGDLITDLPSRGVGKWMNDYEKYTEDDYCSQDQVDYDDWSKDYGTADSSIPVSQTPCGGCGALLHCQDPSIPGYLPSEIFKNCNVKDLQETVCQRCHFLKNYNTALSVTVNAEDYPKLLSRIKDEKALVILLADMTDLPCSIWPGILDIIGYNRPLFLVGNKVDLLWGDRRGWLEQCLHFLRSSFPKSASVIHTALISAKTGFGVEELITKLHNLWQYKGDVYLVGCTNVGKSTLFNALLQSDYCKVKAVDLIQRATTAPWPGTTLNLLKFPILRPDGWRLYLRTLRLKEERKKLFLEKKLEKQQRKSHDQPVYPQLVGHIGRTFSLKPPEHELKANDNFSFGKPVRFGLDSKDEDFAESKWFYDTPGVMHQQQVLDLLTTEEISLTLPKKVIKPRTFILKVEQTLFIAGLARVDYLKGNKSIRISVFSSHSLPVTITSLKDVDVIYQKLLGTEYMVVPQGSEERLKIWPGLERSLEIALVGKDKNESCSDVTLSSAGWVSITPEKDEVVKMAFWTPKGRGIHVRTPSLLPMAVSRRGRRIHRTPAYHDTKPLVK